MCDFKPGDEVVCVDADEPLVLGQVYICRIIQKAAGAFCSAGCPFVLACSVEGVDVDDFCTCTFRKVQRRDLSAWLATTNTIEEPKRTPTKAPA